MVLSPAGFQSIDDMEQLGAKASKNPVAECITAVAMRARTCEKQNGSHVRSYCAT